MSPRRATASKVKPAWSWVPAALVPLARKEALAEIAEVAAAAAQANLPRLAQLLAEPGHVRDFLAAALDLSDFLRDYARRRPEALDRLFDTPVADRLTAINAAIAAAALATGVTETSLMSELRVLKSEAHFLIALAELGGESDTKTTVRRLSALADSCVGAAVDFLLGDAHRQGKLALPDPSNPAKGS